MSVWENGGELSTFIWRKGSICCGSPEVLSKVQVLGSQPTSAHFGGMGLGISVLGAPSTLELGNLGSLGPLIKVSQVAYSLSGYSIETRGDSHLNITLNRK